ncbi:MAG: hypothetical protein KF876_15400 [Nitrospira sp.]|nr:hypothetical protein [Nitrospira sp.]MBX3335513.1 hypothetical protein [Nitrospira sp.]MDR4462898.1 hypothetical protein [Nitrospira sp.]MDR4467548.1 hypothetical protein [Nitrospira sp.]
MNTDNGNKPFLHKSRQQECQGCGETVDLQHDSALVETPSVPSPSDKNVLVWHQRCYDSFLEEGEEC